MSRFIVFLLVCVLLPSQVLGQTEPSDGLLLFREGDVSVHEREAELWIQWRGHSRVVRRQPGALEIRRVHVDSQTDALDLWGPDARYPLLIPRDARIAEVWPIGGETVDIRSPRIFPGDGTVHIRDRITRLCHPRRRDLIRARRASSTPLSLAQTERQASSWTQHRTREFVLVVQGNRLVPAPPAERFFFPGFWSRCENTSPEETTGETAQPTEQSLAFEQPGERVYQDTALGVEIDQQVDPERRTLRVRWQGKTGFVPTGERVWPADETTVRQVMLRRGVPALLVSGEWYAGEDWSYHQNFLFLVHDRLTDGQDLRAVQDSDSTHFTEGYDHSVRFPGDGTARVLRLATRECRPSPASIRRWHRNYPDMTLNEAAREADSWIQRRAVERILDVRQGRFVHAVPRWRTNSRWSSCAGELFAACPFVDVLGPNGSTRVGEILRSTEYAPATQSLALPLATLPARGEVLSIRISEEKAEITFLDEIHIEVDGVFVRPHECTESTAAPAFCQADGNYAVLRNGEDLVVHFSLPDSSSAPDVVAHGYYEPEPASTAHHHR